MPRAQGGLGAAAVDGRLHACGGEQWLPEQDVLSECWTYDPNTDKWTPLPPLPTSRHGIGMSAVDGRIYVFGGATRPGGNFANLFGVLIRLALWPLNQGAMRTSMKMQRLQPELQALQKKHGDDPKRYKHEPGAGGSAAMKGEQSRERSRAPLVGITRREMVARSGSTLAAIALGATGIACTEQSAGRPEQRGGIMTDPMSRSSLAEPLVRIGEVAIARENNTALDAYFAPGFRFHGPGGELTYDQLKAYFGTLRAAFPDLQVRRAAIIGEGSYLAARTIFSGTFTNVFTGGPAGPLQPHGRHIEWQVINFFRYNDDGRLAEEWAQYDVQAFLKQLGAA